MAKQSGGLLSIRDLKIDIPKEAKLLADKMLKDLENSKRPYLEAVKTTLDNSFYNSKVGYLTPGDKVVRTELNVSSVQKLARVVFILEILLRNLETAQVNTKRELYYICKGLIKNDKKYKPLDFEDQDESDSIIDFVCDMLRVYREELNCFANDKG
ncbi:MAG: DNA topoisomerase VI, partial [Bdellovibrionales bacterium]